MLTYVQKKKHKRQSDEGQCSVRVGGASGCWILAHSGQEKEEKKWRLYSEGHQAAARGANLSRGFSPRRIVGREGEAPGGGGLRHMGKVLRSCSWRPRTTHLTLPADTRHRPAAVEQLHGEKRQNIYLHVLFVSIVNEHI